MSFLVAFCVENFFACAENGSHLMHAWRRIAHIGRCWRWPPAQLAQQFAARRAVENVRRRCLAAARSETGDLPKVAASGEDQRLHVAAHDRRAPNTARPGLGVSDTQRLGAAMSRSFTEGSRKTEQLASVSPSSPCWADTPRHFYLSFYLFFALGHIWAAYIGRNCLGPVPPKFWEGIFVLRCLSSATVLGIPIFWDVRRSSPLIATFPFCFSVLIDRERQK